jgi:serine/threonine protein phosphatase PrpC
MLNGINNNTSKTFKSLNIKNDRSHSPLLRTGQNKLMNLGIKPNKNRYISKSPILGKSSAFNRNGGNFGVSLLNSGNNQVKKLPKKTPPKVNTNIHKKIKVNNIIPSQKRNTVISGEIYQDSSKVNNKINYSANNPQNNANINIVKPVSNNNIIVKRNNNNDNLIKISNENEIKSNGMSKKSLNNNKNSEKQNIQGNEENNKEINKEINNIENKEKINTKPIYNKNENEENHKKSSDIKNDLENNIEKEKENLNKNENNNEILKNNELNREKELKNRNNKRSQSQGPVDPFKRDGNSEVKELEEKKDIAATPNKVMKKIKDILPYTHVGFDGEEPKENNQDNYFIFKNFADHKDYIYMSVCDGHGVEGHFVSEFIKEVLPYYMSENLKKRNILKETELVHQIITETFVIVNNMLVDNESINSLFSGTTCVSVIFTPERLIVPNIGDSRAVMGRYDKSTGKYKAIELSRDHKPTEKDEAKRIYENDGRIQPFTEDGEFVGPQRVWIKEEEVPGLAMTRSFGDRVAATVGVMSEPEIKEFDFCEEDKYMIIASDGIWEFISSQECIDIIQNYYENNDLKGCCEYLYQESSKRWLKEEEVIDDTTLILVFFE